MAAGHVVSRMLFQAITADRNARIRALPNRRVSGKPFLSSNRPPKFRLIPPEQEVRKPAGWIATCTS